MRVRSMTVRATPWIFVSLVTAGGAGCNPTTPSRPSATRSAAPATTASAPAVTPSASAEPARSAGVPNDGAIDALVKRLSVSHGLWSNGHFPKLASPAGASPPWCLAFRQ